MVLAKRTFVPHRQAAIRAPVQVRERSVAHVMSPAFMTTPETPLGMILDAATAAPDQPEFALVVEENELQGVIELWEVAEIDLETPAHQLMCPVEPPLGSGATIEQALRLLPRASVACLPVSSHGCIVGTVTRRDLRRGGVPRELVAEPEYAFEELGGSD
jgi:CBS domain-containing protein